MYHLAITTASRLQTSAIHFLLNKVAPLSCFTLRSLASVMMVSLKREREDDVDDDDNEETGKCMLIYVCPTFD